jgi:hypothetical protein
VPAADFSSSSVPLWTAFDDETDDENITVFFDCGESFVVLVETLIVADGGCEDVCWSMSSDANDGERDGE